MDPQARFELGIRHFQGLCPRGVGSGDSQLLACVLRPASFHCPSLPRPSLCGAWCTCRCTPAGLVRFHPYAPQTPALGFPSYLGAWGSAEAFTGPGSVHRVLLAEHSWIRNTEHYLDLCSETQQPLCGHRTLVEMHCRCKVCTGF